MADYTIILEELEISMFLGLHPAERAAAQRVLISARIAVSGTDWAAGQFFDYDRVADHLRSYAGKRIDTQEELASRIHRFIAALAGVQGVEVTTKKPDIYADAKSVGVVFRG